MQYRIGLLIDTLIGGGAERITLNFAEQFSNLGHDVHVFLVKNEIQHTITDAKYKIHPISEDGVFSENKFFNKIKLSNRLKRKITDIENTDGNKFLFFISSAEDMDRLSKMAGLNNTLIRYRNSIKVYLDGKVGSKTGLKKLCVLFAGKENFNPFMAIEILSLYLKL